MYDWAKHMIDLFRKAPMSIKELVQKDNIYAALQTQKTSSQELQLDLSSGNELSPEGKSFCAQLNQEISQEPKSPKNTEKTDQLQNNKFTEVPDFSGILAELQKMRLEEAALLGVKQHLTTQQQELQNKVAKEMERLGKEIYSLRSEIDMLENNCKELAELTPASDLKIERTIHLNLTVQPQ